MNVRTLQAILADLDPEAEVVIVDDDRFTRQLRVGVGGMSSSTCGRDKYVRGNGGSIVGLEAGDELGGQEGGYPTTELLSNDEGPDEMVQLGAILTLEYPEGWEEEMQVLKIGERLQDGSCVFVVLEGEGGDRYTVDIMRSGLVRFETAVTAKASRAD
jgi:hypothetical protein